MWSSLREIPAWLRESDRHLDRLLAQPVTVEGSLAAVRRRLAGRVESLIRVAERAIFAQADSPYQPLLGAAGYDASRFRTVVEEHGVEGALAQLAGDGVFVSIEEFKGQRPVQRGKLEYRFDYRACANPDASGGLEGSSSGTRGAPRAVTISPENYRLGAEHLAVALSAYKLEKAPAVIWMASSYGASLYTVLALTAMRKAPHLWVSHLPVGGIRERGRLAMIRMAARRHGVRLPRMHHLPLGRETHLVPRLQHLRRRYGRYWVFTTPSLALRLSLAARSGNVDLSGCAFITTAEPLTGAKLRAIESSGAQAFSALGFAEFGRASYGCAAPSGADDMHLCKDALAMVSRERTVDAHGTRVAALLLTSLQPSARLILLNVETGDYADQPSGSCGCVMHGMGWDHRLREVRSFEKLNAEGRLFYGSRLIRLVEEDLPQRFGGSAADYQLVEREDERGFTRLFVFVHPRLNAIDDRRVVQLVTQVLESQHIRNAQVLQAAGTIRVIRAMPVVTRAGKQMALHHMDGTERQPSSTET